MLDIYVRFGFITVMVTLLKQSYNCMGFMVYVNTQTNTKTYIISNLKIY